MKFSKMVRWQLILAGLATALYFAPAAQSQEITNTPFADGPNVTTFAQPEAAQPSAQLPAQATAPAATEATPVQASLTTQRTALIDSPWVAAGLTLLLFTVIAVYAIGDSKRVRRETYVGRRYPSYRRA
jgi:hypothetical protein